MKKIIVAIATLLPILLWNCSNEPEAPAPPSLKMRLLDSVVINKISRQLNTTSDEYPVPWNPADKSTWREIQLDTVYDEDQGQCLAVGAITLYITKGNGNPYELRWLSDLKELYIFGCTDSYFYGEYIPSNVNTLVIDRLNPDDPGFIKVINHWRLLKSVNAKLLNSVFMLVTRFSGLQTLSHFSNDYIGVGALKLGSPIFHECRTIHFQPDC